MKLVWIVALPALFALSGCNRGIETKEAVRQGIIDHLSTRSGLDVKSMQIEVTSVSFRKNEADATVSFRPKGSTDPGAGMHLNYTLERQGNRWMVKGRRDAGGASPHGGGMPGAMPPPMDPGASMPPGHPPMTKEPSGNKK